MFVTQFSRALLRLFCLLAFALCFSGIASAQQGQTLTVIAPPPRAEGLVQRFTLRLSSPASQRITVLLRTQPGVGPAGAFQAAQGPFQADYQGFGATTAAVVTFEVNQTEVFFDVPTFQDNTYEFDENFSLIISNVQQSGQDITNQVTTAQSRQAVATILNDDTVPTVTIIPPPAIVEGDTNVNVNQQQVFVVDIAPLSERPFGLVFTTTDGSATSKGLGAGAVDFQSVNGQAMSIPAGVSNFNYAVTVFGDDVYEGDEAYSLSVRYDSAPGAVPEPNTTTVVSTAVAIITDNDLPTYVIDDAGADQVIEGGIAPFVIRLLDRDNQPVAALQPITFNYTLESVTATLGQDFNDPLGGVFTIRAGERQFILDVPTVDDNIQEQVETFRLVINTAPGTRAPLNKIGNASIFDNDSDPTILIDNAQVVEGTTGTNSITFTARLTSIAARAVSFTYDTVVDSQQPDATRRATPGADFTAASNVRVTFPANQAAVTFTVPIVTDSINELDETFRVVLSNPTNATFTSSAPTIDAVGTIIDDDAAGVVSLGQATLRVDEGVAGGIVNVPVSFTPNGTPARPTTVDFTTVPGTATSAGQPDYFGKSGRLTFNPGQTSKNITIEIVNDNIREGAETFSVRITAIDGATSGAAFGPTRETIVTIIDDDPLPRVSVGPSPASFGEGEGSRNFIIALEGNTQSEQPVTVNYAFEDVTAINNEDYIGTNGSVTFNLGGPRSFFVPVTLIDDNIFEGNELFRLRISLPDANNVNFNFEPGRAVANAIIVDNDRAPDLTIENASAPEGSTGDVTNGSSLTFNVTLSRVSSRPVSFTYSTLNLRQPECVPANGCDVASDDDYQSVRNVPVTIPAGTTGTTIVVPIRPDANNEFNEQFAVVARALVNAVPSVTTVPGATPTDQPTQRFGTVGFGTIVNDDAGGVITIASAPTPGSEGYRRLSGVTLVQRVGDPLTFVVTLPAPAGRPVTVNYTVTGAASADDYVDETTGTGFVRRIDATATTPSSTVGSVTFFPGTTTRNIVLRPVEDNLVEDTESVRVSIFIDDRNGANSFTTNNGFGTGQILDRTPGLRSVTPTVGFPRYGTIAGTRVTVNGVRLRTEGNPRVSAVLFGNVAAEDIQYISDDSIAVTVPDNAKTGQLTLRLNNGFVVNTVSTNVSTQTPTPTFVVQPVITSFTPTVGVGGSSVITITGRNFQDPNNPVTGVLFNGVLTAAVPTIASDTRLTVMAPAGAASGPLRIVSRDGNIGPASQTPFNVGAVTAGSVRFGPDPDRRDLLEGSTGTVEQPARNFDGSTHQPYLVFVNPARFNSGPAAGSAVTPQRPIKVQLSVTDNTEGGRNPAIAVQVDATNAGRPTLRVSRSSADGIIVIDLDERFNPANPIFVYIVDAGTDNLPPVAGGAAAKVRVSARIVGAANGDPFFPNTAEAQVPFVEVDRREVVTNTNQTAIAFAANTATAFSVPFVSGGANSVAVNDVFNLTPTAGNYSIYRYDVTNQMNDRSTGADFQLVDRDNGRLQRGLGYLIVTTDRLVQLSTRGPAVTGDTSFTFNLTRNVTFAATATGQGNATNGYNFIGFPFNPVQFSGVNFNNATVTVDGVARTVPQAAAAGLISGQLLTLGANGALTPVSGDPILRPFQAYFVQVFRDNVTLTLKNPTP